MIRILQIVPTLGYGGIANVVLNYYKNIDKKKYCFDFVTHGGFEEYHQDLIDSGSKIYYINKIPEVGIIKYFQQIEEVVGGEVKYDSVHIHLSGIRWYIAKIAYKHGVKNILCHAHSSDLVNKKEKAMLPILRLFAKKYATNLIACSKSAGLFNYGKEPFQILPNAIDIQKFMGVSLTKSQSYKNQFNIDSNTLVIGHVGSFVEVKNHKYMLEILNELKNRKVKYKALFIGDGPLWNEMKKKIDENDLSDKVILTGNRNDVENMMSIFDVFLLPSIFEGLPLVGIEAQVSGCNCIFSDNITSEVDLQIGNLRFLDINDHPKRWADAIIDDAFKDKPNSEYIRNMIIKSEFNINVSVKKLIEIYAN